jgi:hypothetical protein
MRSRKAHSSRVPVQNIIYLYNPERPGRGRGFSRFEPAISRVRELQLYQDAELARKNLETRLSVLASGDTSQVENGSVRVRDAAGKVVQVLDDQENYYHDTDALGTGVDFNNDGCPDLKVTNSVAGIGNESLSVFLYNPATRRFEFNRASSDLGGLDLDSRDPNCVTGFWKGGAVDMHSERHCWKKGKLVKEREWTVSARYNGEGEFQCYQHEETIYRGGKKHTHTDCTKAL